ncbi:MAG TPA: hypothetical protein VHX37_12630 [Acidobacteriaceae bacterium]|jgi:hypothetical protein|nr:hypothetical protein [Acidobacteriaceae bacterium]
MKSGLDNKRNVAVLVVLLLVMLVAVVYFVKSVFLGSSSPRQPTAQAPPAATGSRSPAAGGGHEAPKTVALANLDPTLHPEIMAEAESLVYSGKGRNIFSMASAPPKIETVLAKIRPGPEVPQVPAGPPPPPPIDLKFFGYEAEAGSRKAFLLHGDDVFIAAEGDVVDHHYKILKISPLSIQVTDLLYSNTQTLPLTQS